MRRTAQRTQPEGPPACDNRSALLDVVEERPGSSLLDVAEELDLHVSTVSYHARRLEEMDRLHLLRDGRCVRLFPKDGMSWEEIALITALKSPRAEEVLEAISDTPGATKTEVAEEIGLSVKGVGWHIDRLDSLGVVRVEGDRTGYSLELAAGVDSLMERIDP